MTSIMLPTAELSSRWSERLAAPEKLELGSAYTALTSEVPNRGGSPVVAQYLEKATNFGRGEAICAVPTLPQHVRLK